MATFSWTSLNDGDVVAFDPLVDVFHFDDAAISAADIVFDSPDGTTSDFSFGGKTVTLIVSPFQLVGSTAAGGTPLAAVSRRCVRMSR